MDAELYHANLQCIYDRFGEESMTIPFGAVAEWLGVDRRTLQRDRTFPIKKIGRAWVCAKPALASWLSKSNL